MRHRIPEGFCQHNGASITKQKLLLTLPLLFLPQALACQPHLTGKETANRRHVLSWFATATVKGGLETDGQMSI